MPQSINKKWIVFDAMGVIFESGHVVNHLLGPFVQQLDSRVSMQQVKQLYTKASEGKITAEQLWSELGFVKQFPKIQLDYLTDNIILDLAFIPTVKDIRHKYKIGLISNDVKEWAKFIQEFYHLNAFFETQVISGEFGVRKPDPRIYKEFLVRAHANGPECVYIDDKLENLAPAAMLGFHTIFMRRDPHSPAFLPDFKPDAFIDELSQLSEVLPQIGF